MERLLLLFAVVLFPLVRATSTICKFNFYSICFFFSLLKIFHFKFIAKLVWIAFPCLPFHHFINFISFYLRNFSFNFKLICQKISKIIKWLNIQGAFSTVNFDDILENISFFFFFIFINFKLLEYIFWFFFSNDF